MKAPQKSLKDWTDQKWRTKSGKRNAESGKNLGIPVINFVYFVPWGRMLKFKFKLKFRFKKITG